MGVARMSGLIVPQLGRKLRLLVDYGRYESLKALAASLGRSDITLRGWVNGASGTPPDRIPPEHVARFLSLYAAALPSLSEPMLRNMVLGPAEDLEALLAAAATPSLRDLIAREADTGSESFFLAENTLSLTRTRDERNRSAKWRARLGADFRIEFATKSRAGFVTALQSAPSGWGAVPCAFDRAYSRIHLPGPDEAGRTGWLYENTATGRHLFVAMQGAKPFPPEIAAALRDHVPLDRTILAHVMRNWRDQNQRSRRLFALEVEIERQKDAR